MVKRARKPKPSYEAFLFTLGRPTPSYSFWLQHDRRDPDPYSEHLTLGFEAECLSPARFRGRTAKVDLLGSRDLVSKDRVRSGDWSPRCVAGMTADKSRFSILGSLPFDACWHIAAAIAGGTLVYLMTNGPTLSRGQSLLNSISFEGPDFEASDYVG